MHLLEKQRSPSMKEGIRQIDPAYPVFVDAVKDGFIQGQLYVDDVEHPLVFFLKLHAAFIMLQAREKRSCHAAWLSLWMFTKDREDKTAGLPYFQRINQQM
ncbi:hypothetical protein [Bacillus pumilus]|uniref:hypothetical protein n=1 Tax=Bacillus pumilus TaxID=1408 RepID=UPI002FFA0623